MGGVPSHFVNMGAEVCMSEQLVSVDPMEEKVSFEGVPSSFHFSGAFWCISLMSTSVG